MKQQEFLGVQCGAAATWTLLAFLAAVLVPITASAEEAVNVGGALALLNKPAAPRAAVILIPGGSGVMNVQPDGTFSGLGRNQLVRTRKAYLEHGIASLTVDSGVDIAAAVIYMRGIAPVVIVVGTSRGTLRAPAALPARPNGLVLTSGFLDNVRSIIGSSDALPVTLVIHHRYDSCHFTPPAAVEPFKAWGGSKVHVVWIVGGSNVGNPCEAQAYHGFNGLDGSIVSTISQFALSVR